MRIMAKRPLSDVWLDLEMPHQSPTVVTSLNGPGSIDLTVSHEYGRRKGEDGHPILLEYGTLLVAESDSGQIIQAGLVDSIDQDDQGVQVSAGGLSMLTTGTPWNGADRRYYEADPITIFKDVWAHLLSPVDARVGLALTGSAKSGGSLGVSSTKAFNTAKARYAKTQADVETSEAHVKEAASGVADLARSTFAAAGMSFVGKFVKTTYQPSKDKTKVLWVNPQLDPPYLCAYTTKQEAADKKYEAKLKTAYDAAKSVAEQKRAAAKEARRIANLSGATQAQQDAADHAETAADLADQKVVDAKALWEAAGKNQGWVVKGEATTLYHRYLAAVTLETNEKAHLKTLKAARTAAKEAFENLRDEGPKPYEVNWYSNQDLGQTINDLREAGPFEYRERTTWSGDNLAHTLELGAPKLGVRREDLRFEIGVNITTQPTLSVTDRFTEVIVYGAGEGSAQVHGSFSRPVAPRVRRVQTVTYPDAVTPVWARAHGWQVLEDAAPRPAYSIDALTVADHSFARRTQYGIGDEIRVTGPAADGTDLDLWVRVTEITITDDESVQELKVETL